MNDWDEKRKSLIFLQPVPPPTIIIINNERNLNFN